MSTTSLRKISLEQRLKIGELYKDGLKATKIAPLYNITTGDVNYVVHFLRNSGVIIPYKNKRRVKKPELLVLPEEFKKKEHKRFSRYTKTMKREAYALYKQTRNIEDVMKAFNLTKNCAYYIMKGGRALSGGQPSTRRTRTVVARESDEGVVLGYAVIAGVVFVGLLYWVFFR